ncbi:MAG TPA: alpha-amylase family glycosyl hydrolase [Acidimicrobiales bacterium]|nr:alpha-amylase family glycosyl hydrolase [Acidimicrobiales bacterium]
MDSSAKDPWWRSGVLYEVYPRSFADSDGDGIGDLGGLIDRLDHLEWLGVDGIWLSPVSPSPNADWGYDVADYCAVDPDYGTLETLDALVAEANRRGIRILLDLVPNHTSEQHPWFVDSRSSRSSEHRDWYVWADPGPDGSTPNNWTAQFGGPAWTLDQATGQYYLHNFTREQPDLNWWNPAVHRAFEEIITFWWDRGVSGFRIDVCNMMVKDVELRDNPTATDEDSLIEQLVGQRYAYNANRPEVHGLLQGWRALADTYDPPRVLLGETDVHHLSMLAPFYGNGADELHLAFNLPWLHADFTAEALRSVVEETERILPEGAWPVWTGSNLDTSRLATRWAKGHPGATRCILLALLTLRGTPVIYQGDEIGLPDGEMTREALRDPIGVRYWPHTTGRDPERSPMPWDDGPGRGFSASERPGPWLPMGTPPECNVAAQRDDPRSVLTFTRDLMALRRSNPDLHRGASRSLASPAGTWVWQRGHGFATALNLGEEACAVGGLTGSVALGTDRGRDGEHVEGRLTLGPGEGVLVRLA